MATAAQYEAVHGKVKTAILRRGEGGIKDLSRTFKIYDDDGNKSISKAELKKGLGDYGLRLTNGVI
jgi:hypothetical protein